MLKLNQSASLEENKFIKIGLNIYQLPAIYTGIEGKYDLSNYDDLTIIIPETIRFFDSLCLTCSATSPSKHNTKQPKHKIVFNHISFNNVKFSSLCFDGIVYFEVKSNEIVKMIPDYVSSYPFTIINSNNNSYFISLLNRDLKHKIDELTMQIDNIKIMLKNCNNDDLTLRELKCKLMKCDDIESKLLDINRLLL